MKSKRAEQLCLAVGALLLGACSSSSGVDRDYEVLEKVTLDCPDGAHVEYQSWGGKPTGMIATCKLDHGPYVVALNGRLHLKGENRMGRPVGEVTVFDETGAVQRQEKAK